MSEDILGEVLRSIIEGKENEGKKALTEEAALDQMAKYKAAIEASKEIQPGDLVERNFFGEKRYRIPENNQLAWCIERLPFNQVIDEGQVCDMVIGVVLGPGKCSRISVDSTFYQKKGREAPHKNVVRLKRDND